MEDLLHDIYSHSDLAMEDVMGVIGEPHSAHEANVAARNALLAEPQQLNLRLVEAATLNFMATEVLNDFAVKRSGFDRGTVNRKWEALRQLSFGALYMIELGLGDDGTSKSRDTHHAPELAGALRYLKTMGFTDSRRYDAPPAQSTRTRRRPRDAPARSTRTRRDGHFDDPMDT